MPQNPIIVIGVGISPHDLSEEKAQMISGADVLVAGERLLSRFVHFKGRKIVIRSPLPSVMNAIEEERLQGRRVVVAAEGDPGFFGIGRKLLRAFGDQVVLLPNVTSLQAAASRMRQTSESMVTVSLHGRGDIRPLFRALVRSDRVGAFTDPLFTPGRIAEALISRGADLFRMWVFENMGEEGEKFGCFELSEARTRSFSALNFIVLERTGNPEIRPSLGLDDDLYLHEAGLITKKEVRAVGLAALGIAPHHTVWDLGAGCGSVSIEASLLAHEGAVLAVEKEERRAAMIHENVRRMGAYAVETIRGEMPACLKGLPEPDRIFVGGGLGRGKELLHESLTRLRPGGVMVLHIVLLGTLDRVRAHLRSIGWGYDLTHVQVSRSHDLAGDERLSSLNPVYILRISKPS